MFDFLFWSVNYRSVFYHGGVRYLYVSMILLRIEPVLKTSRIQRYQGATLTYDFQENVWNRIWCIWIFVLVCKLQVCILLSLIRNRTLNFTESEISRICINMPIFKKIYGIEFDIFHFLFWSVNYGSEFCTFCFV